MIGWFARRPAVAWSMSAVLCLSGAVAFSRLSLATKTAVELPRLQVSASWAGASPELMEMYITAPVEGAVHAVRGVRTTSSESRDGYAIITVELEPKEDVQIVRLAILERLELLRSELPVGVSPPRVANYVPQELQEAPLLRYTISGPYTPGAMQQLVEKTVVPRLSAVPGVASVGVSGGSETGVAITYDPSLLQRVGIAPERLSSVISNARMVRAAGEEHRGAIERAVSIRDQPATIEQLADLPVPGAGERIFRLGDLATVRPEEDDEGRFYRINGEPTIALSLSRQAGADAIRVAARARETMESLEAILPAGTRVRLVDDESVGLGDQLRDLATRGTIAFAAVMLVLGISLRDPRAVGIVMLTAAVSIAGTALCLYALDLPANLLTLAGLGMGIGVLVQNGLVVMLRVREAPDDKPSRAAAGSRMLAGVMGSTLTTAVVLIPFLYLQGNARAAFVPFAIAFLLALGWSVAAALLLVPALGPARSLSGKGPARRGSLARRMRRGYGRLVGGIVRFRWLTLAAAVLVLSALGWGFWKTTPTFEWGGYGLPPTLLQASLNFPRGSDPDALSAAMAELEQIAIGAPGVEQVVAQSYGTGAGMRVEFDDDWALTAAPLLLEDALTQRASYIGGAQISVRGQGPAFSSGGGGVSGSRYSIKVMGYSYAGVEELAADMQSRLERIARVRDVHITGGGFFDAGKSYTVTLDPDRAALARSGLTAADLTAAVARQVRGRVGRQLLEIGGEETWVTLKAKGARDRTLLELRQAELPAARGEPVRIGDVAIVGETEALGRISREDQQYLRFVQYGFRGPAKLAERTHKAFMASVSVPSGYSVEDDSYSYGQPDDSDRGLWLVFGIGVVLVILSVAVVFDSVWGSAMVLGSLPLALGGVAGAFLLAHTGFTREAAVGVVIVVGLAVNQAILLTDAALRRRSANGIGRGAIVRSSMDRAGMIVLVTITTLASLIPLAVGTSTSSLFGGIALATAGGTVAGTLGTMLVLPAMFALGGRRTKRVHQPIAPISS
jgi:HAE1 family hydrophobic/amphiphilic exporter-1